MTSTDSAAPAPTVSLQITKKMLQSLAPLPATAVQMLALLDDPEVPLRRISDLASRDVGIAAAILRMANSAMLGMRGRIGSITEALRLIGTGQARLVVLTCGVAQAGQKELTFYGLPAGAFMRHSELVASLTMAIARETGIADAGIAYSAGLLHDIGKPVLNGIALENRANGRSRETDVALRALTTDVLALEHETFGTDHALVGRDLAQLWALPEEIAEAIQSHHKRIAGTDPSLTACLALANAVAGAIDDTYPASYRAPIPEQPVVPVEPLLAMAAELQR